MGTTIHGQQRLVERVGEVKDPTGWLARAYNKGKDIAHYSGERRSYLENVRSKTRANATIKVFSDQVYIFNEYKELVTVMSFPKRMRNGKGHK